MKALVLVGGLGTRLRPITYSIPKQLIPIAGKPMLYHVLDLLPPDVEEATLATGYKSPILAKYLEDHPPRLPTRCVAEPTPLGTGGGMRYAGAHLSDPFYLLNSDVIAQLQLERLREIYRQRHAVGVMSLARVEDTRPYGVAALDSHDRIIGFVEKPEPKEAPSNWINAGIAVWNRQVIEEIPSESIVSFEREILPRLLPRGVYGYPLQGYWEDAGTPDRLLKAQRLLFDSGRGGAQPLPGGAEGRGPVAFGSDITAHGAKFGGYVHLDTGVTVEPGARVEDSVLMRGVKIGANAFVQHSVLGPRVVVPPDTKLVGAILAESVPT